MAIDTITIAQFIAENRISSTSVRVIDNPNMEDNSAGMDHWKVTLRIGASGKSAKRRALTIYFAKGSGHKGAEPTADEVLACLGSDSSSVDDCDFETWCSEFGYDTDSRKAERTYKVCQHQARRLLNFLGVDLYGQLLYGTERL